MEYKISDLLKKRHLGPFLHVLIYLDELDIKKLAFVISSNYEEMKMIHCQLQSMSTFAKKIESKNFDSKYLSFYSLIPQIIDFIDKKAFPLNHLTDEESNYIKTLSGTNLRDKGVSISRLNPFSSFDLENIKFGITRGEKISKDVIGTILFKQLQNIEIVKTLMDTYKDSKYVLQMINEKALVLSLGLDTSFHKIKDIYELFGIDYLLQILSGLDINLFMKQLLHSVKIYSDYITSITDSYLSHLHPPTKEDILRHIKISETLQFVIQKISELYFTKENEDELSVQIYLDYLSEQTNELLLVSKSDDELYSILEKKYQ